MVLKQQNNKMRQEFKRIASNKLVFATSKNNKMYRNLWPKYRNSMQIKEQSMHKLRKTENMSGCRVVGINSGFQKIKSKLVERVDEDGDLVLGVGSGVGKESGEC